MSHSSHFKTDAEPMNPEEIQEAHHRQRDAVPGPSRCAKEYPMKNKPRGRALIFKHEKYNSNLKLHARKQTEPDKERLRQIFTKLHFLTDVYDDLTLKQIQEKLSGVSKEEREEKQSFDCLVVVVMTHGIKLDKENNQMSKLYAFDEGYHETELWKPFIGTPCRTYRGKPKLFFIQACRSEGKGSMLNPSSKAQKESHDRDYERYSIPENADFLVVRSFYQDCPSFRDSEDNSIFIQSLCKELEIDSERENKKELNKILLTVHDTASGAARDLGGNDEDDGEGPFIFTTEKSLTRQVYFRNV